MDFSDTVYLHSERSNYPVFYFNFFQQVTWQGPDWMVVKAKRSGRRPIKTNDRYHLKCITNDR